MNLPTDPDQSAPTPEEVRTEPHVQDAQDAIFVLRKSLAVASWRDFGLTVEPILTRLYHAAKIAGQIEALAMITKPVCHFCGNDWGMWEPEAARVACDWEHQVKAKFLDDRTEPMPCAAGPVHDALAALKSAQEST